MKRGVGGGLLSVGENDNSTELFIGETENGASPKKIFCGRYTLKRLVGVTKLLVSLTPPMVGLQ